MATNSVSTNPNTSYVEWSTILAGSALALAISFVFLQFGTMLGLQVFEPDQASERTRGMLIGAALWLFWVQLVSSMAGGYIAGRLRRPLNDSTSDEADVRDGAHGILVWATSTLVAVAAAALGTALAHIGAQPNHDVKRHVEIAEEITKNAGIVFGFTAAAGSFVSAAAAAWLGKIGGDHRDKNLKFTIWNRR